MYVFLWAPQECSILQESEDTRSPERFSSVMGSEFCCEPDWQQPNKQWPWQVWLWDVLQTIFLVTSRKWSSFPIGHSCPILSSFWLLSQSSWEMGVVAGHNKRNQQVKQELSRFVCRVSCNECPQPAIACLAFKPDPEYRSVYSAVCARTHHPYAARGLHQLAPDPG